MKTYDLRINIIDETPENLASIIFQRIFTSQIEPDYRKIKSIYENDSRGNIRDFFYGEYSHLDTELGIIFDTRNNDIINFRLIGPDLKIEQVPRHGYGTLKFIGETSEHYRLKSEEPLALIVLKTIVIELEKCGMEGYKTEDDIKNDPIRLEYILKGTDPHLVFVNFGEIEYNHGLEKALLYLEKSAASMPEFSKQMFRIAGKILKYKNDKRSKEYFSRTEVLK